MTHAQITLGSSAQRNKVRRPFNLDAGRADGGLRRRLLIGRYTPRMKARRLRWLV
jgi:hypothetical protein